ncbi:MAG: hypothetical protein OHK0023_21890 [Anaerolineae bacterium]
MPRRPSHTLNISQNADSLPESVKYTRFRSQLEISFALALEARGIRWFYEQERIERYLVDFYLPDCRVWVEVKGVVSTRDHLLLRTVAAVLAAERKHRLYMYTSQQTYLVGEGDFQPLSHDAFWDRLRIAQSQRDQAESKPNPPLSNV